MTYKTVLRSLFGSAAEAIAQTQPLPGQVANSAGGYFYPVGDWARLDRFLILGSEGGSYYASELRLTAENAAAVERVLAEDGRRAVARIVEIGRSPASMPPSRNCSGSSWRAEGRTVTSEELKAVGEALYGRWGWQTKLARTLKVDGSTVRRWLSGASSIPGPAEVAMRLLLERAKADR